MALSPILVTTYQHLMNTINAGLLMIDEDSNICVCNKWFDKHCEFSMTEKISINLYQVFPELENGRIQDAISNSLSTGYPALVSNIFTPCPFPLYLPNNFEEAIQNDDRIQQQVTISRLEVAGEYFCLIQINDVSASVIRERALELEVSERKQIENALLESEIKHLTIMEKMIDGLIVFNDEGVIESFNPACETMFGYSESAATDLSIYTLFEGLKAYEDTGLTINANFIGAYREIKAIKKDQQAFDVELSISKMNISGKVFYTAIIRDITERKNVEKLKTEFISTVSHELRTPLTSIRGSLGLMCGGAIDLASEKALNLLSIAYNNCGRLVLLINDILDMEKIAAGGMEYEICSYNIHDLLKQSIVDNKSYADEYKVTYQLCSDNTDCYSDIDQHRFLQVMSNLLSNAAKFSHKNGVVDICVYQENQYCMIEVQDYGEGIPDSYKKNIWSKFTQADASTTRKKGGTGLGLAISQSLITDMGGQINFHSEIGKGTVFSISLPMSGTEIMIETIPALDERVEEIINTDELLSLSASHKRLPTPMTEKKD